MAGRLVINWTDGFGSALAEGTDLSNEVFSQFPFGLIVLDRSTTTVAWNATARRLLGPSSRQTLVSCCTLFGCGRAGGPLEHACLTDLAEAAEGPLPEIRVDLPEDSPADAVWVTAARLATSASRIVVQIRPGERNDRRRRTHPHWMSGSQVRITTLGRTSVESQEGPISGDWLDHRTGQILKYLACERGRLVPAEEIAAAIWPGEGHRVLNTLRHYIHVLRETLEPGRPKRSRSSFILGRKGAYSLDPGGVTVDADVFLEHVRPGIDAFHEGDPVLAAEELEAALALYQGDFLADEPYSEWAFAERDRLQSLAGQACRILAEIALRADDLEAAAPYVHRLVQIDYFDPEVQRALLVLCMKRGRRSEAVRRYRAMQARVLREFGEEPTFALSDVSRSVDRPLQLVR